jgi:hypothetical protein
MEIAKMNKNMNNKELQLVTFEQAKKLKELGFDWKSTKAYNFNKRLFSTVEPYNHNSESDEYPDYSAPSIALALKWIRDEKALDYRIQFNKGGSASYCRNITSLHRQWAYACYEAAESTLLDELLSILEEEKEQ